VHKAGVQEIGDVFREREMRIKGNTKIDNRGITAEEELLDKCIGGSGIFFIWSGRRIIMNSVFEWLRQRRLRYLAIHID